MTIAEAIDLVNRLTANQVSDTDKISWLNSLDLFVYQTILSTHCIEDLEPFNGYRPGTDPVTRLLVPAPYDEIYRWYLEMQIHTANGETAKYNGAASRYNMALQNYMDFVTRKYHSKDTRVRWW